MNSSTAILEENMCLEKNILVLFDKKKQEKKIVLPQSQGSKFKTNQYCKIRLQIFDNDAKILDKFVKSEKKYFVHCPFLQSQAK